MGVVAREGEVFVGEVEEGGAGRIEVHLRKGTRLAAEKLADLVEVVSVDVEITEGVDELAWLQAGDLSGHHQEEGIAGDVEGDSEEGVGAALVKLQRQAPVGHVELEEGVARGKIHVGEVRDVPGAHYDSAGIGIVSDVVYGARDLVDGSSVVIGPRAPLIAVDMAEVAVGIGPLVPDADAVVLEITDVGVAGEKPEKFVDDALEVKFFCGEEGEAVGEVEPHLIAEG